MKSKFNPDGRCVILKNLAKKIPSSKYLDYALSVEALTLEKKANLILNVDGHIAASVQIMQKRPTAVGISTIEASDDSNAMHIDMKTFSSTTTNTANPIHA